MIFNTQIPRYQCRLISARLAEMNKSLIHILAVFFIVQSLAVKWKSFNPLQKKEKRKENNRIQFVGVNAFYLKPVLMVVQKGYQNRYGE